MTGTFARFRYLSLCVALTACATTPMREATPLSTPSTPGPAPHVVVPTQAAAASSSAMPATAATPSSAGVQPANYATFDAWEANFRVKARAHGFSDDLIDSMLAGVQPLPGVTASDSQQPEFSKPTSTYIRTVVTQARIDATRTRLGANPNIADIERNFGVPACVLGGIWSMESDLGRVQGNIDVVAALATLAYNGRRRVWAEDELLAVLTILRDHGVPRQTLKGSWAGAMGQTQFEPDSYLSLGVDGDHDGRVDIWNSDSDALASTANLLSKAGWKPGEAWDVEVILPGGFDDYLAETTKMKPDAWQLLGLRRADGGTFTVQEMGEDATLLLPSGANGPAFLAMPNHYVIRKYNNSTSYALGVGLIADGVCGKPATHTPWPVEPPLSLQQRIRSQQALKAAGFDPGAQDGVIGVNTRQAIRDWQRANHRPADGYLSFALANEFVALTGGAVATPDGMPAAPIPYRPGN
jgi:lytic murein transglycosylase